MKIYQVVAIVLFLLISSSQLFAQTPPPGEDAGAQIERFQTDLERKKEEFSPKETKAPEVEIQEEAREPSLEGPSFILKEVDITGMTVFTLLDLYPAYKSYLDTMVTFSDIESIIEKIKTKYRSAGYLTIIVYLPEQDIKDGKIEIRVVEGKMGELNIEGNKRFSASLIEKYFHTRKGNLLNIVELQKDILRLIKNPDLEIKAVITAGKVPQTSDVTLKVEEAYPHHLGANFDNHGTRATGKYREGVYFRSTNLSGRGDLLIVNSLFSSKSFGQALRYLVPIDTYGMKLGMDITYFKMKLGKEYKSLDITGNTQIYTPYFIWELYLSENFQADANLGMEIKYIKKRLGRALTANDQLRIPFLSFDFTRVDSYGQTEFSPRFNFSVEDFLGASAENHTSASRVGTGGFFFKYEHSLSRIQRMPFDSYAIFRSRFQAASHSLPSAEQFQLGGANSIRGYPEGDYLADIGGSLNFDWVFPMYFIPRSWRIANSDVPLRRQIEPLLFIDVGRGKLKSVISGEKEDKFLVGVGGGLRVRLGKNIYLRCEWAKHVGDRPTGGSGPSTFHLAFQTEM